LRVRRYASVSQSMSMWWASVVNAACGDSLASFAIRCRRVEMGSGLGVPGIFPSSGLMARRPLPSAGSLGSVPPRRRYMRRSDSPPPVPPRFVAFAWRYHGRTRVSLPWPPGAPAAGLELVTR
jgi:hypothetical protein